MCLIYGYIWDLDLIIGDYIFILGIYGTFYEKWLCFIYKASFNKN